MEDSKKESKAKNFIKRYCNNKLAVIGFFTLVLITLIVIIAPPFLPFSEAEIDPLAFNMPPSAKHLLGGDDVGRDVLSRLLYGGRVSLAVGIFSTAVSVIVGIPLGMLAAFYRGAFEVVVMRLSDIFMSFPSTILILFLVSMFGPSIITVTVVIGVLGYVGQPIGSSADNDFQYTLNVKGRLSTPEEFGDIILRVEDQGKVLRLKDVAKIELGSAGYGVVSRLKGQPTAAIAVYQLPGSNSLDVSKHVRARMAELAETFPAGVKYNVTLDTTDVVHDSIDEVMKTFVEAIILVVLVIFFFLQSWRAVLIPCLTIPVSLIGTLAVMAALGFSINTLTLFGLILAIAIVVDDAIVVTENATRILDEGKLDARAATEQAMGEITGPIVGVVLVLLAVFIPTTLISGISGQLYKQFALTIAASTVISGFNSLTLTPAVCALLLRPTPTHKARLFLWFDKMNDWMQRVYDASVKWLLARPVIAIGSYIVISVIAILMFVKWPSTFIPEEDDGYFMIAIQLPAASSLERTQMVGKQIDAILSEYPEVKTYLGVNGFSIMGGGQLPNAATYFVVLKNWKERAGKEHTAQAVVNRFNGQAYAMIQEAQVFGIIPPAIPGMGNTGGLQLELEDRKSLGPEELQKAVEALLANYHNEPAVASMSSMYQCRNSFCICQRKTV